MADIRCAGAVLSAPSRSNQFGMIGRGIVRAPRRAADTLAHDARRAIKADTAATNKAAKNRVLILAALAAVAGAAIAFALVIGGAG